MRVESASEFVSKCDERNCSAKAKSSRTYTNNSTSKGKYTRSTTVILHFKIFNKRQMYNNNKYTSETLFKLPTYLLKQDILLCDNKIIVVPFPWLSTQEAITGCLFHLRCNPTLTFVN